MTEQTVKTALRYLGGIVVLAIALIGLLLMNDKAIPDVFEQVITAGVVGIVGVLGAQRREATDENPMPVANVQGEPLEVTQTPKKPRRTTKKA